jgi:fructosamine-3-kinase
VAGLPADPVEEILRAHRINGPWAPLPATGIANRIYATADVVLRIATDHPDGVLDARTESVAAPVARAAGIKTPELIVFDDSRVLIDRPYSIWERVHGETLGLVAPDARDVLGTWAQVGRELAKLHLTIRECPDPHGWLDAPEYGDPRNYLAALDQPIRGRVGRWLERLSPALDVAVTPRFLHGDLHDMNVMCSRSGNLLALIDWGDAGWGDPAIEFTDVPLAALPTVVEAYESIAPGLLGAGAEARILWYRLARGMKRLATGSASADRVAEHLAFREKAPPRWKAVWG